MSDSSAGRSAFVVDNTMKYVYLIVTGSTTNYTTFRAAIETFLDLTDGSAASTRFMGLFLDGGGSSQIRAYTPKNALVNQTGDGRYPVEVITLRSSS